MATHQHACPDIARHSQDFNLIIDEKDHVTLRVLIQTVGPWQIPVAYLPKQWYPMAAVWSPCLCALVAIVTPIKEADKLMLEQSLQVKLPHLVMTLMNSQAHKCLSNTRMVKCQGLPWENPKVTLETVQIVNPAIFLLTEASPPDHAVEKSLMNCSLAVLISQKN